MSITRGRDSTLDRSLRRSRPGKPGTSTAGLVLRLRAVSPQGHRPAAQLEQAAWSRGRGACSHGILGSSPAGRGDPLSGQTGLPGSLHGSAEPTREWAALGDCGWSAEASGLRARQGLNCCCTKRPLRSHGWRLWGAQPAASRPPGAAGARTKGCSVAVSDGRPFIGAANLLAATSRLHSALPMGAQCHAGP